MLVTRYAGSVFIGWIDLKKRNGVTPAKLQFEAAQVKRIAILQE
jgi:hypothetical protein